jgi:predicted Na+-dependent transporter
MPGTGSTIGLRAWWPPLAATCAVLVMHAIPGSSLKSDDWWAVWHVDKVFHVVAFAVWGLSVSIAWAKQRKFQKPHAFAIRLLLWGLIFGMVLEAMQGAWMQGRSADPWDVLADLLGTGVSLWIFRGIFGQWPGRIAND